MRHGFNLAVPESEDQAYIESTNLWRFGTMGGRVAGLRFWQTDGADIINRRMFLTTTDLLNDPWIAQWARQPDDRSSLPFYGYACTAVEGDRTFTLLAIYGDPTDPKGHRRYVLGTLDERPRLPLWEEPKPKHDTLHLARKTSRYFCPRCHRQVTVPIMFMGENNVTGPMSVACGYCKKGVVMMQPSRQAIKAEIEAVTEVSR